MINLRFNLVFLIEMCLLSVVVEVVSILHFRIPFQNHWLQFNGLYISPFNGWYILPFNVCRYDVKHQSIRIIRQILTKLRKGKRGLNEGLAHFHSKKYIDNLKIKSLLFLQTCLLIETGTERCSPWTSCP